MESSCSEVAELLQLWSNGRKDALDRLLPQIYAELRQLASSSLRRERHHHALQATALVHQTFLKIVDQRAVRWQNRVHATGKRSDRARRVSLDEALTRLAALDPQQSRVVELRIFGGLTMDETAKVLHSSPATVGREWTPSKAWSNAELQRSTA